MAVVAAAVVVTVVTLVASVAVAEDRSVTPHPPCAQHHPSILRQECT